jgi:preprotein translocase subunit SecG
MEIFLITMHILAAFVLVAVVLLQHGKGADIGATFGAGASQTVFGGRGASNFLSKMTTGFVVVFMLTSISLSYFSSPSTVPSLLDEQPANAPSLPEIEQVPAGAFDEAEPISGQATGEPAVEEIAPPTPQPSEPAAESAPSGSATPPETPEAPAPPAGS